ncbi:hypothetical protein Golomagni_04010, partial [Golovinomyces magnicellulatus]
SSIMSSTVNKIKDALHINDNEHTTGKNKSTTTHYGNAQNSVPGTSLGAHGIERANPANPRFDSNLNPKYERSGAAIDQKIHTGTSAGNEYTPGTGLGQNLNSGYYPDVDSSVSGQYPNTNQARESHSGHTNLLGGSHSSTVRPHDNDFLNKIDPRVQYSKLSLKRRRDKRAIITNFLFQIPVAMGTTIAVALEGFMIRLELMTRLGWE